jgi:hypothetical protein
MAFINNGTTVISFADYYDVQDRDQRLFDANEGLTDQVVEDLLIRSTERILSLLRATDWWVEYYVNRSTTTTYRTVADVPALDINKIQARQNDFTDLCVYYGMFEYILPKIADFSDENNAERQKIGYYQQKFNKLFAELVTAGDWYNFDGAEGIDSADKQPGVVNLRRVR